MASARSRRQYRYTVSRPSHPVLVGGFHVAYDPVMPRLWTDTIEAHRHAVVEAILETTWRLASERGLRGLTMSEIAEQAGIGRATLYKYFPDVESILHAWHDRHVAAHLEHLTAIRDQPGELWPRLEMVLSAYAGIARHRSGELGPLLHQPGQVAAAEERLLELIRDLIADAATVGTVRRDISPDELANYCLHALSAAGTLTTDEATDRLVTVTLAGLRPPP